MEPNRRYGRYFVWGYVGSCIILKFQHESAFSFNKNLNKDTSIAIIYKVAAIFKRLFMIFGLTFGSHFSYKFHYWSTKRSMHTLFLIKYLTIYVIDRDFGRTHNQSGFNPTLHRKYFDIYYKYIYATLQATNWSIKLQS